MRLRPVLGVVLPVLRPVLCSVLCLALVTACAEDSDAPAHDEALCLVAATHAPTVTAATAGMAGGGHPTVTMTIAAGPPRDSLFLKLISSAGAFSQGLRTGTFSITGVDTGFTSCGLCVNIVADVVPGQGATKFYQATSGEVTLTSVTPPLAGSVSNVTFVEVDLAGNVVPGCTTKIASATFMTGT